MAKLKYILPHLLPGGTEGTVQTPVRIAGFLSKIQNRNFLHTSKDTLQLVPSLLTYHLYQYFYPV